MDHCECIFWIETFEYWENLVYIYNRGKTHNIPMLQYMPGKETGLGQKVTEITFEARVRVEAEERKKSMCVKELYQTYNRIVCHFYIISTHLITQNIANSRPLGTCGY